MNAFDRGVKDLESLLVELLIQDVFEQIEEFLIKSSVIIACWSNGCQGKRLKVESGRIRGFFVLGSASVVMIDTYDVRDNCRIAT